MRHRVGIGLAFALAAAASGCVGDAEPVGAASQALLVDCDVLLATGPHVPIASVLPATITGPGLLAGGGIKLENVAGVGTHFNSQYTCFGVFDAGMTSDPATGGNRQYGAIAGPGTWTSATQVSVNINPASLVAGTPYWLRMVTQVPGGWEVAEGALVVN